MNLQTAHQSHREIRNDFPSTRWSLVSDARGGEARKQGAIETLCESYWHPVYSFIRRTGKPPAEAEDITQSFFQKILSQEYIQLAEKERGKFRSFLLAALKRHMADLHRKATTLKRGGNVWITSFDRDLAEKNYSREPSDSLTPDLIFQRRWVTSLLERVMADLRAEYVANGKGRTFDVLESFISWNDAGRPQQDAADELGIRVAALRVELFQLRRRFKQMLENSVAETLAATEDLESELDELRNVFS